MKRNISLPYRMGHVLLALFLSVYFHVMLHASAMQFKNFSSEDNLSSDIITSLTCDNNGKIWIGTDVGINWYDSERFVSFYHVWGKGKTLCSNHVKALYTDCSGVVWIGTEYGLSCYNIIGNDFSNFYFPEVESTSVHDIVEYGGKLYLATSAGLACFDKKSKQLYVLWSNMCEVRSVCLDGDTLLCGTHDGILVYNLCDGSYDKVNTSVPSVVQIVVDPRDRTFWVGTDGYGLFHLDSCMSILSHYSSATNPVTFSSDIVNTIFINKQHELWIGTSNGLLVYSIPDKLFITDSVCSKDEMLRHTSITSIFEDMQGGMWIGTSGSGLSYHHPRLFRFRLLDIGGNPVSLEGNKVNCIIKDDAGNYLWVGVSGKGVIRYDVVSGKSVYYSIDNGKVKSNDVRCILPLRIGILYICTCHVGIYRLDVQTGQIKHYNITGINSCHSLLEYDSSTLWVGGENCIYSFDTNSGMFSWLFDFPAPVKQIFRDSYGRIWVVTSKGLFRCSEGKATPVYDMNAVIPSERHIKANVIMEDSCKNIWIGTSGGLYSYDESLMSWKLHSLNRLHLNYNITGIIECESGKFLVSTNKGLAYFYVRDDMFSDILLDGISTKTFLGSFIYANNNCGYVGTRNGVYAFDLSDIDKSMSQSTALISGVALRNIAISKIRNKDDVHFLQSEYGKLEEVSFPASIKYFRVAFSIINYISVVRNKYEYRLLGYEDEWTENFNQKQRSIDYSDVPPGRYVFQLRVRNFDGVWSKPSECVINIVPLWYQTLWGRLLIGLLGFSAFCVIVYFYIEKKKMRNQALLEHLERVKMEELGQEKIRFYVNMSHELRTPLNLILPPLEDVLHGSSKLDKDVENSLHYVYRNSRKLLEIVNRLLDFRKVEVGAYPIHVGMFPVETLVCDVLDMFRENALKRGLKLEFYSDINSGQYYPVDKNYLEIILNNLLSNAFKYTSSGDSVSVRICVKNGKYVIIVRDTGIGIPVEEQVHIFERFYQVNEQHKGSGIGLSFVKVLVEKHHGDISLKSEVGRYTEFEVSFPASIDEYSPEELAMRNCKEFFLSASWKDDDYIPYYDSSVEESSDCVMDDSMEVIKDNYVLLFVDDNCEILSFLKNRFDKSYVVLTAENGEKALDIVRKRKVDLILSDVMMPVVDGIKLCEMIKKNIQTCHIPFIMLSAKGDVEAQTSGIFVGADDYISKPFSIKILEGKIRNMLKSRERLRIYYTNTVDINAAQMTSNPIDEEFVKNAIRIVEENMEDESFGVDGLAAEIGMSRSSLYLKMNSISGEPPANFIRRIRLNKACHLLQECRYSISEISTMTGFKSPSYFSTCFKKYKGCMPSDYLTNNK